MNAAKTRAQQYVLLRAAGLIRNDPGWQLCQGRRLSSVNVQELYRRLYLMPTYDYVCKKCGKQFEYFQSMSAEVLKECPQDICEQPSWQHGEVERKIGAGAGLIFNGSGFYLTDYKNSNSPSASSSPSAPTSSGSTSSTPSSSSAGTSAPSTSAD